jgi:hypothetical protein
MLLERGSGAAGSRTSGARFSAAGRVGACESQADYILEEIH